MSGETKQQLSNLIAENRMLKETVYRLMAKPSLRDRFAMTALPQIQTRYPDMPPDGHAKQAYVIADAMLRERSNEQA